MANTGAKAVAGYAIVLDIREEQGRGHMKAVHSVLVGSPRDNFARMRNPGESWVDRAASFVRKGSNRTAKLSIAPTIDYVLFADNSSCGADGEKRSLFLAGLRAGASAEFQHYAKLLRESGPEGLAEQIRQVPSLAGNPKLPGELRPGAASSMTR